jgi:NADH dehydrogenase
VVIVGGGLADCWRTVAGNPVQVTLIDRQNFHTFQPCSIGGDRGTVSGACAPIRWILRRRPERQVLMSIQDFDFTCRKVVKLADGEEARYDHLIGGLGGKPCLLWTR